MQLHRSGHKIRTADVCIDDTESCDRSLAHAAKELSEVFGVPITWHFHKHNNDAVWGDFGCFVVTLPDWYKAPCMEVTDAGLVDHSEEMKTQP